MNVICHLKYVVVILRVAYQGFQGRLHTPVVSAARENPFAGRGSGSGSGEFLLRRNFAHCALPIALSSFYRIRSALYSSDAAVVKQDLEITSPTKSIAPKPHRKSFGC